MSDQASQFPQQLESRYQGQDLTVAVVVSRFNQAITDKLLEHATKACLIAGLEREAIDVFRVAGALEIPFAVSQVLETKRYAAVICLGAIIRGETEHHRYIAETIFPALQQISLNSGVPFGIGILTTDTFEQALERTDGKKRNTGLEAACAALESVALNHDLKQKTDG